MSKDWNNIDLDSHEVDSAIVDEYTFEGLLLEIECNLPVINLETVRKQFYDSLYKNMEQAKEVFEANLHNIVRHAQKKHGRKRN